MSRPEEMHARNLYERLSKSLVDSTQKVEIEGAGVHWKVVVSDNVRLSTIHCFHYQMSTRVGEEYLIKFSPQSPPVQGRTESVGEAIEAAIRWTESVSYQALCEEFSFVDFEKRGLLQIRQDLLQEKGFEEDMLEVTITNPHSHTLNCTRDDRRVEIRYWSNNALPNAYFLWDGTQIHEAECLETAQIKESVEKWVLKRLNPFDMQNEFPFLQTADVAPYFEQGEPIAGEFIVSWEEVEEFYLKHWRVDGLEQILALIRKIRSMGFERNLRAGTSMYTLMLYRSRRYRPKQPYIAFNFTNSSEMQVTKSFDESEVSIMPLEFSKKLHTLLSKFCGYPID